MRKLTIQNREFEDIPIPYKLILKNFGSHEKSIINFGEPYENCFFQGSSGRGKTHIIRGIQCALGKKPKSDNEIFTYMDTKEDGKKRRSFRNTTEIQLILKNSGKNHLQFYPKDAEITVGVKLYRNNPHKNRWYIIDHNNIETTRSRDEIQKIFGKGDDPLIFIPQGQTDKFIQKSPLGRFNEVSEFIGIATSKKQVQNADNQLKKAKKKFNERNHEYEKFQIELKILEENFRKYKKKLIYLDEKTDFEKKYVCAKLIELYESFFNQEKKLNELDDVIQDKILKISQLKVEIKNLENKINQLTNEIENLENEKIDLNDIIGENDYRIKDFSKKKQQILEVLGMAENQINEYDIEKVEQEILFLKRNIDEVISKKFGFEKNLDSLKEELKGYQNQRIPIPIDSVNLQTEIKKKKITSEFLFETIDFKKNQEKWRVILESILDREKIGLVVSEKHQILTEKINRENHFNATVLSPRHEFAQHRKPEDSLCNWNHIFEVCPQKLSKNTIIDLMDLKLGGIYFLETPDDLERYRTTKPFARFASLDGYYYTIYSQSKIIKSNRTMIGKGAIEIEILRIQEEILKVNELINLNITNLEFLEERYKKSEIILEILKLIKKSKEIADLIQNNQILKIKLEEINEILRDPKKSIEDCENKIRNNDEQQKRLENELEIDNNEFQALQKILELISNEFNGYLIKYNELNQNQKDNNDIEEFFIQYKEESIEYRGLLKKIKEFLRKIEEPTEKSENLNIQLECIKSALDQYNEYSEKDQINYETAIDDSERHKKEIIEFSNEIRKCEEQFNRGDTQLIEELSKWQRQVSKVFSQIMNELELDGELVFQRGKSSIDFELNIRVSNTIGGVFENIEESNFSGGETQRTAVAFMIAIISQSRYPYVVWDEFDSHVGEDHREMIAEVIKKYFSNRKLLALSPQDIVQGYVRVFPRIYEVWKNDDGFSRLSLYISENNKK